MSLRIRCERCATVYELDEKRLPARGASVKCTRCQHVFRAVPPAPAEAAATAAPRPPPSEDRTEAFGFSKGAPPETTASFASSPPPAPPSEPVPHRPSRPRMAAVPPPAAPRPARWPWILVVLGVVAAALVAAWLKTR
jgi:predicted Zn finger-like uncharacterized protein